ncbi:cytochrome P450 [Helicobacter sp. 23-1048]
MIKVVWFDFGGVLSPPIETIFDIYYQKTGILPQQLKEAMSSVANDLGMPMLAPIENAKITQKEWGAKVRKSLQKIYPTLDTTKADLEHFGAQWFSEIAPNKIMIWLFKQLKKQGYSVGILTNNVIEWESHWRTMIQLDNEADFIVDSCKFGYRKPDIEIFEIAQQIGKTQPCENILIDDVKENCLVAKNIGWDSICFANNAQTIIALREKIDFDFPSITNIPNYDFVPAYKIISRAKDKTPEIIEILSGHKVLHITNYDDVRNILSSKFCIRKPLNQVNQASVLPTLTPDELLLNLDGAQHDRAKKIAMSGYSLNDLEFFKSTIANIACKHLKNVAMLESFDLFEILDDIIIEINSVFVGIDLAEYKHTLKPLTKSIQIANHNDKENLIRDFTELYEYILHLLSAERIFDTNSIIGYWLQASNKANPPLNDKGLCGLLLGSILGGYQNILTCVSKIIYAILYFPIFWELIKIEKETTQDIINELFRLTNLGTTSTFPRLATQDIQLANYIIPKHSVVYADVFLANRDSTIFHKPLQINPFRKNKQHLQFGYGKHSCMGRHLAMLELQIILQELATHLPNITLDNTIPIQWDNGVILHRPKHIPILNLKETK